MSHQRLAGHALASCSSHCSKPIVHQWCSLPGHLESFFMIVWTAGIYDVIKSTFHVWVFARKPKKKKRKVKEDPMAKASGPSNAEQAHSMRNVFGFTSTPPATNGTTQAEPAQPSAALQPNPQDPITPTLPAPVQQPQVLPPGQQPVQAQQAQQQPLPAQQAQHAQQAQQQPVQAQQAQQQPAMQPQQQATFKFGFAADRPAEADSALTTVPAQMSHQAAVPAAQAPVAEQSTAAAQPTSDHVPRRVFIGGMPFSYEVSTLSVIHPFIHYKRREACQPSHWVCANTVNCLHASLSEAVLIQWQYDIQHACKDVCIV